MRQRHVALVGLEAGAGVAEHGRAGRSVASAAGRRRHRRLLHRPPFRRKAQRHAEASERLEHQQQRQRQQRRPLQRRRPDSAAQSDVPGLSGFRRFLQRRPPAEHEPHGRPFRRSQPLHLLHHVQEEGEGLVLCHYLIIILLNLFI